MRYQANVNPTEWLARTLVHTSQPESSYSANRAGLPRIWACRPSFGSPGTNPGANRHWPLTFWRSSALFRSKATLGICPPTPVWSHRLYRPAPYYTGVLGVAIATAQKTTLSGPDFGSPGR